MERFGGRGSAIDQLFAAAHEPQFELERNVQINQARYRWKMVNGQQFSVPGFCQDGDGQEIIDFVNADQGSDADQGGATMANVFPINVLGGDCYKFVAVLGQSAPRVKAIADDPTDNEQLGVAMDADAAMREAWTKLRVDHKWRVIAFHQFTTGPSYIHTPYVVDKTKYGQSVEPKIGVDENGLPTQEGVQQYPNGDVEMRLYTVIEVSHPYGMKEAEDLPWLLLEFMESKYKLLDEFEEKLDKYRDSEPPDDDMGASSTTASEARDALGNPSGIGRPKKSTDWRFRQLYCRPVHYQAIKEREARKVFQNQYPNGLYIAKVGSINVLLDDRQLDDEWTVCKTGRGEKIIEDPICKDVVPIQRAINDIGNMALETVLRAIAKTVVDQMLFDRRSLSTNEALPSEVIFTTTPGMGDITKMIAQLPTSRVSDQLMPIVQWLRATMQDLDGVRPELSGGGAPTQTYREAKQRKEQALAQLGPQSQEMQFAAERIGRNIVRQRARYGSGTIKSPRKTSFGNRTDVVDQASLVETGWHCEADDNFPITAADTADKLWGLLKEFPPEVQQALSLLDPVNLERNLQLLQLPGYESTYEDQKRKTLADIDQLLQAQPIEGAPGPDGQPGPPQPSLPVDSFDDHQFVSDFLRKWMISKEGQDEKYRSPQGFANVAAFQMAQFQAAQPPPPPAPPLVRPALSVSAKLEDMPPEFTSEIMKGAGLPGNIPAPPPPPPQDGLAAPQPVEGPAPEQESPLPTLPEGPPTGGPPVPTIN